MEKTAIFEYPSELVHSDCVIAVLGICGFSQVMKLENGFAEFMAHHPQGQSLLSKSTEIKPGCKKGNGETKLYRFNLIVPKTSPQVPKKKYEIVVRLY